MRWELATNEQLWTIISDDWHVTPDLLEGLVNESLRRNLFDHLIKHLINKTFDRWDSERRFNFYDLFQEGYIGIVFALKNYCVGKGSFKTFAYMNIKSQLEHYKNKARADKRKVYESSLSLDVQKHEDNEEAFVSFLVDDTRSPERIVVEKMYWEEQFGKVTPFEKEILVLFAKGYSMNEIARLKGYKGAAAISKYFHRGMGKINPSYIKQNLKDLGLVTRTKGA